MDQKEITYLLQQPASITPAQTLELKEVLEQYPFFQAARAVMLKGLKNQNSLHYNKELKLTAAQTSDRAILFDFITSDEFNQNQIAEQIKKQEQLQGESPAPEAEANAEGSEVSLDQALREKIKEADALRSERVKEYLPPQASEEKTGLDSPEQDSLKLGEPLQFNKNENHSFSEWLKLTKANPVKREHSSKADQDIARKYDLIDEFISKSPKIVPSRTAKKANLAEEQLITPEALMTETLARVYLEQKNYKKAIQAYKILILKNPEKSGFFADQIRGIKKIQEQNNKE